METSQISPNVMNLAMTRGALSFAPFDDSGVNTGEVDLGNVTSLELTNAIAYKDHMTSHDSVVVLDAQKPSEQRWKIKFTPDELSAENMAFFLLGDADKQKGSTPDQLAQTGDNATIASFVCRLDRWFDLGYKYVKPGSISVSGQPITELVSGDYTNYRVDYENGLLMLKVGFGYTDGETITSTTFLYGTCALRRFVTRIRPLVGFLRYRGLSEQGPRHSLECWKVQITPDSALGLIKPSDYASLSFGGDVYIDDATNSHKATDPFFKLTELDAATSYPDS